MTTLSRFHTFEHGPDVICVHAFRSIVDGWSFKVTIIGPCQINGTSTHELRQPAGARFATSSQALAAAEGMARRYLDGH